MAIPMLKVRKVCYIYAEHCAMMVVPLYIEEILNYYYLLKQNN